MALNLASYNFLTDRARELFKLSKEAECLLGTIFKDPDPFYGLNVYRGDVISGWGSRNICTQSGLEKNYKGQLICFFF